MEIDRKRILAISGSDRVDSVNTKLLLLLQPEIEKLGAEFVFFDVREKVIPMYSLQSEVTGGIPDTVLNLRSEVLASDAIVFASPEFNAGYTPLLKSVIDWGSRPNQADGSGNIWKDKPVAVISASPSAFGGSRSIIGLRQVLAHVEMLMIPLTISLPHAYDAFGEDGKLKDERAASMLKQLSESLIQVVCTAQV